MKNKRKYAWCIIGVTITIGVVCSIRPARGFSKVEIMRRKSNEILREIGVAVLMWQEEHKESRPVGLAVSGEMGIVRKKYSDFAASSIVTR